MKKRCRLGSQKGFTLIELISVMIIMGVMSSVAVKKIDFITYTASTRALATTVKELNVSGNRDILYSSCQAINSKI